MKKLLFIYPHFPPSNLVGAHRPRLFANHLQNFGWEPVILTVHENYYEEKPDYNLVKLLPSGLRVEKVKAFPITRIRLIGDIGLRGYFQLRRRALDILRTEKIDFIYFSLPSFYVALMGPWLYRKTGVKYGIDYMDPWVHSFPGSKRIFSRHWFATKLSSVLEPIAVSKVSLITGVAESYYQPVLNRYPHLKNCVTGAMPFGFEESDFEKLGELNLQPYLFKPAAGKIQFVYAGALLPKAHTLFQAMCKAISHHPQAFADVEFHFIGTGRVANDANSYTVKPYAEKYGIWQKNIFEYAQRIPYLDVLVHLQAATAVFILGSTERHYTPSKTYQGVLSGKPVMAILHKESTAVPVLEKSGAGKILQIDEHNPEEAVTKGMAALLAEFRKWIEAFNPETVNRQMFASYSAKNFTATFAHCLDQALKQ